MLYSNYFYKLYSYRKNFNTKVDPDDSNNRVYVGLDFSMLVDLSKFDRDIRYACPKNGKKIKNYIINFFSLALESNGIVGNAAIMLFKLLIKLGGVSSVKWLIWMATTSITLMSIMTTEHSLIFQVWLM